MANGEKFKLQNAKSRDQAASAASACLLASSKLPVLLPVASPMPSMPSSPSAKPYTYILSYLLLKLISVPHFLRRSDGSAKP